jgi:C1A family cysteine protease
VGPLQNMSARTATCRLLALLAGAHAFSTLPEGEYTISRWDHHDLFSAWKAKYGRSYATTAGEAAAFAAFKDNHAAIEAHNADPSKNYKLAHNHYSDITPDEHRANHLGFVDLPLDRGGRLLESAPVFKPRKLDNHLPASWDWTAQGKVTSVKCQGNCGDCWAFASSAAIESAYAIENNVATATLSVSPQQLTSCTNGVLGNYGCSGGNAVGAFTYLGGNRNPPGEIASNGATLQGLGSQYMEASWTLRDGTTVSRSKVCACKDYPFTSGVGEAYYASMLTDNTMCGKNYASEPQAPASTGTCDTSQVSTCDSGLGLSVGGFGLVASEADLQAAVHQQPVVVAVNGGASGVQYYKSGVFDGCTGNAQNHAVLVVGWGTDSKGGDYWKIKNSWGSKWGYDGYWHLKRGVNMCGIGYTRPGSTYTMAYPTGVSGSGFPPPAPPNPPPPLPPPLALGSSLAYRNPKTSTCASGSVNLNADREVTISCGPIDYPPDCRKVSIIAPRTGEFTMTYPGLSDEFGGNTLPCAPTCSASSPCPSAPTTDGATAQAQCMLNDGGGSKYCALMCYSTAGLILECPHDMSCYMGHCVYKA